MAASRIDQLLAGAVSGPLGRGFAFVADFAGALATALRDRMR